jgi:hypothetical protein
MEESKDYRRVYTMKIGNGLGESPMGGNQETCYTLITTPAEQVTYPQPIDVELNDRNSFYSQYHMQIATDLAFTNIVFDSIESTETFQSEALSPLQTYYTRIRSLV